MLNPLNIISKFIKSGNQKELDRIQKIVKEINLQESKVSKFEDNEFPLRTNEFISRLNEGEKLNSDNEIINGKYSISLKFRSTFKSRLNSLKK